MKCLYIYSCAIKWATFSNSFLGIFFLLWFSFYLNLSPMLNYQYDRPYWIKQWFYRQTRHPASISFQAPSSIVSAKHIRDYHLRLRWVRSIIYVHAHGFVLFLVSHDKMYACYIFIYMTAINRKPRIRSPKDAGLCRLWIRLLGDNVLFGSNWCQFNAEEKHIWWT